MTTSSIEAELASTSYVELFEMLGGARRAAVLSLPDATTALRRYVRDREMTAGRRFLAAELLYRTVPDFPDGAEAAELPAVYAAALDAAEDGGPWGLPGQWDGPVLKHLVDLGPPALSALAALLDHARPVGYAGSIQATLGQVHGVRVKDIAAHAILRILDGSTSATSPAAERDVAIARLAAMMKGVG